MLSTEQKALRTVDKIPAMVAYWDNDQKCVFANESYQTWFGRDRQEMVGISMRLLLGPLYVKNLPYIQAALLGITQNFERQITLPSGVKRDTVATYTPDILDGIVLGFSVFVADVTPLRDRELALEKVITELVAAKADLQILQGLLPVCANCKSIRDENGEWQPMEIYLSERADVDFTHGICPVCAKKLYANFG
ncbi:MAG: PAS domain-containing protein [Lacunisphaera sp.]